MGIFIFESSIEHVNCSINGYDEKTFRKWCRKFVILLSDLRFVSKNHHVLAQVYSWSRTNSGCFCIGPIHWD